MSAPPEVKTVEYWDARARIHRDDGQQKLIYNVAWCDEHADRCRRWFAGGVLRDHKVLDVCCGYGRFQPPVLAWGGQWTGLDFSREMHEMWKPKMLRGEFIVGCARNPEIFLAGRERSFDVIFEVISLHVLGWTPLEFRDFYRPWLKPSGVIACLEDDFTIFNFYD
jgi:ubiquinone/menaquinone biosynthesis C-methylase UbiE